MTCSDEIRYAPPLQLESRLAATHDVRLAEPVRRLVRGEDVRIETHAGTYTFDAVVVATPVDRYLDYAGADARLERLQGARRTWFVGELFAGVTVPHGTEYACAVADAMAFGNGPAAPAKASSAR